MLRGDVFAPKKKSQTRMGRPLPRSLAAGVPDTLPTFARLHHNKQYLRRPQELACRMPAGPIFPFNPTPRALHNVESATIPTLELATKHGALAKAAAAFASPSTTCAVDGEYGGPREPDEDDSGAGTGYARTGWLRGRNVSIQC
jgi:hypothetical protein